MKKLLVLGCILSTISGQLLANIVRVYNNHPEVDYCVIMNATGGSQHWTIPSGKYHDFDKSGYITSIDASIGGNHLANLAKDEGKSAFELLAFRAGINSKRPSGTGGGEWEIHINGWNNIEWCDLGGGNCKGGPGSGTQNKEGIKALKGNNEV